MPKTTVWTPNGVIEREANEEELAAIEQLKTPRPLPLSTRLENILRGAGQQLADDPNPSAEVVALVQQIMGIDSQLSKVSERFGGDTPLYRAAAKDALTKLGVLPADLEPARLAMLDECEV